MSGECEDLEDSGSSFSMKISDGVEFSSKSIIGSDSSDFSSSISPTETQNISIFSLRISPRILLCALVFIICSIIVLFLLYMFVSNIIYKFSLYEIERSKMTVRVPSSLYSSKNLTLFEPYISYFGEEEEVEVEYECSAECFCPDENERRVGLSVAPKLFQAVFFATSLLFAYDMSQKYFHKECVEKYSEYCTSPQVDGLVCFGFVDVQMRLSKFFLDVCGFVRNIFKKTPEEFVYNCFGYCVSNKNLELEETKLAAKELNCENFEKEGQVSFPSSTIMKDPRWQRWNYFARSLFVSEKLHNFCREKSVYSFSEIGGKLGRPRSSFVNLCTAERTEVYFLENVACELVES